MSDELPDRLAISFHPLGRRRSHGPCQNTRQAFLTLAGPVLWLLEQMQAANSAPDRLRSLLSEEGVSPIYLCLRQAHASGDTGVSDLLARCLGVHAKIGSTRPHNLSIAIAVCLMVVVFRLSLLVCVTDCALHAIMEPLLHDEQPGVLLCESSLSLSCSPLSHLSPFHSHSSSSTASVYQWACSLCGKQMLSVRYCQLTHTTFYDGNSHRHAYSFWRAQYLTRLEELFRDAPLEVRRAAIDLILRAGGIPTLTKVPSSTSGPSDPLTHTHDHHVCLRTGTVEIVRGRARLHGVPRPRDLGEHHRYIHKFEERR